MFAYDNLVQWFKDRCSDQVSRRNRAWNFGREHGLEPCVVAWNNVAVRWIDGVVYVVSRNVRRDGSLGRRYAWSPQNSGLGCTRFQVMSRV